VPPVSFLPLSQKAKKKKPQKKKRSKLINSGRVTGKQPESRFSRIRRGMLSNKLCKTGHGYLSRRRFPTDDQPECRIILPLGDGPHRSRRFTSAGCQASQKPTLRPLPPAWLSSTTCPWLEAKTHVLFQETTERWGSDVIEYPQGHRPGETKLGFMGLVKKGDPHDLARWRRTIRYSCGDMNVESNDSTRGEGEIPTSSLTPGRPKKNMVYPGISYHENPRSHLPISCTRKDPVIQPSSSSSSLSLPSTDCQRSTRRHRRRGNRTCNTDPGHNAGEDKILPINHISSIKDGSIAGGLKEKKPCCLTALTTQEFATENEAMSPHGFPAALRSRCVQR
jgi:hypothetical protein